MLPRQPGTMSGRTRECRMRTREKDCMDSGQVIPGGSPKPGGSGSLETDFIFGWWLPFWPPGSSHPPFLETNGSVACLWASFGTHLVPKGLNKNPRPTGVPNRFIYSPHSQLIYKIVPIDSQLIYKIAPTYFNS